MSSEPDITAKQKSIGIAPVDMATSQLPERSTNVHDHANQVVIKLPPGLLKESLKEAIDTEIHLPENTNVTIFGYIPETPLDDSTVGILLHDPSESIISLEELKAARIFAVLDVTTHGLPELQEAIDTAGNGRLYISVETFESTSLNRENLPLIEYRELSRLSPRELEVAALVAERLSNKEIAKKLHVAETTVKNHVKNAREKLGSLPNRFALADWYMTHST
jgi:DNA-binding CsgD family transcriptional regulator